MIKFESRQKKPTEVRDVLSGEAFTAKVKIHVLILWEDFEEPSEKVDQVGRADVEFVYIAWWGAVAISGAGGLIDEEHVGILVPSGVGFFEGAIAF